MQIKILSAYTLNFQSEINLLAWFLKLFLKSAYQSPPNLPKQEFLRIQIPETALEEYVIVLKTKTNKLEYMLKMFWLSCFLSLEQSLHLQ